MSESVAPLPFADGAVRTNDLRFVLRAVPEVRGVEATVRKTRILQQRWFTAEKDEWRDVPLVEE